MRTTLLWLPLLLSACSRRAPSPLPLADASATVALQVRVPGALSVARAIDSLSVGIDPASLALAQISADAAMTIGVEADVAVFSSGQPRAALRRHAVASRIDFDIGAHTWTAARDGIPVIDAKYVVEMQLVLFQTDVPAPIAGAPGWDPRAGHFKPLWTRTLRQAEE